MITKDTGSHPITPSIKSGSYTIDSGLAPSMASVELLRIRWSSVKGSEGHQAGQRRASSCLSFMQLGQVSFTPKSLSGVLHFLVLSWIKPSQRRGIEALRPMTAAAEALLETEPEPENQQILVVREPGGQHGGQRHRGGPWEGDRVPIPVKARAKFCLNTDRGWRNLEAEDLRSIRLPRGASMDTEDQRMLP